MTRILKNLYYLLIILINTFTYLYSGTRFEHITVKDGLSTNTVICIFEDSRGFMWFGTQNGLNRYDGKNFKVYKHVADDSSSLSNNLVQGILEDENGDLWIATWGGGLNKYHTKTERFTQYRHDPNNSNSLSDDFLMSLFEDRKGNIWIGTTQCGINKFDIGKEIFIRYAIDPENVNSLSHNVVKSLYEDKNGIMWIGTMEGIYKFDPKTEKITYYKHDPDNPKSLSHNIVISIIEDDNGTLWVATYGGGLNKFDKKTESFSRFKNNSSNLNSLSHDEIQTMYKSSTEPGVIWIATSGGGINKFDIREKRFTHYKHDPSNPASLSTNITAAIYEDKSGLIWVGTAGKGICKYNKAQEKIQHYKKQPDNPNSLFSNHLLGIYEDQYNRVWIGTDGFGLDMLDRKSGVFKHYEHLPNNKNSLCSNKVYSIVEEKPGLLWISTIDGLSRLQVDKEIFSTFKHDPQNSKSISHNTVNPLYIGRSGILWFGTLGGGLNKLVLSKNKNSSGVFRHYMNDPANPYSISNNNVSAICEDNDGFLWVGIIGGGLNKFDIDAEKFTHYQHDPNNPKSLSHNYITAIHVDSKDNIWVGTYGGGLNKFDPKTETFINFLESDGLANDVVYGILEDNHGNLWISTRNGLSKFDPTDVNERDEPLPTAFKNYYKSDGFQDNEFTYYSYFKNRKGELFFGGINGLNIFYPDSLIENRNIPNIVLTEFKVLNKPFKLDSSITTINKIILLYDKNFFSFRFAALDFMAPHKNQYAYMLEGLDDDWIYSETRDYASYTAVSPGEYTFRVKGSNNDGVWNEEGASIKIIITPPFWKRSWFLIVTGLLLLSGIVALVRFITTRKLQQQLRVLEQQRVMERERSRISSDMHDEVGASLTHIAITSELLKKSVSGSGENEVSRYIEDISGTAREVIDSIGEIIWAINPRNDSLDNLIAYIRQYSGTMFELTPIRCRYDFPENSPQQTLTAEVRRNIFLVVKEALNNILKHAQAEEVHLNIDIQRNDLEISINDNGKGFCDQDISPFGNGLKNMKQRMADISGTFDIHSRPGKGTRIRIKVNLRF